jgi:hypothetical protein
MTTYYVQPMGDGTFRIRHGSELVAAFGEWTSVAAALGVVSDVGISWEWEDMG